LKARLLRHGALHFAIADERLLVSFSEKRVVVKTVHFSVGNRTSSGSSPAVR
jgi:hypothetical protein